jgi:manganese/zinc/iron transport system permease protein
MIYFNIAISPALVTVLSGSVLICGMSALVGVFTFLRKRSLIGDVIAHSVLPGIALAFMITESKATPTLLLGGALTGALAAWLIDVITRNSKLKTDAAIALNTSVFFGIGIVLLTRIQHLGMAQQSGLDRFLFGKAAALQSREVFLYFWLTLGLLIVLALGYRGFKMISFDESYSRSIGLPVRLIKLVLMILTVMVVALGVQSVGVVLMSALLITPAAIGRFASHSLIAMMAVALLSGIVSGVSGTLISYAFPAMPTGPWIVICLSFFALIAFLFSKQKGIISRWWQRHKNSKQISLENFMKSFYPELSEQPARLFSLSNMASLSRNDIPSTQGLMSRAKKHGWIKACSGDKYQFTEGGYEFSKSIVRKHRLWELYLNQYLQLKPDHVHENAEDMEHLITPEIEQELLKTLDHPEKDPHDSKIPY